MTTLIGMIAAASEMDHKRLLTFGGAIVIGVFLVLLSEKIKTPSIVLLLIGGIIVGPEVMNLIDPAALGEGLNTIVSLSVGMILFEGGLSLDPRGYRQSSREIRGLVSLGMLTTWIGTAVALHFVRPDLTWKLCFLIGSLVTITGPSIVGPMLQRIGVKSKLHHILHWEGVLNDPTGVFLALLIYKFVQVGDDVSFMVPLIDLLKRLGAGIIVGGGGGVLLALALRKKWIPEHNLNIFVLASAIAIFGLSDLYKYESGLLAVTIAGFTVGCQGIPAVRNLRTYKAELIELLVGMLFVLLTAKLELSRFQELGLGGLAGVLAVILIVRPLTVFVSTIKSTLTFKEKLFLSWVSPRGIIAASMASLFALNFVDQNNAPTPTAVFIEGFTYSILAGTVLIQGFTAGIVGRMLGVLQPERSDWLIVGAHRLARRVAGFIKAKGFKVVVISDNPRQIALAKREGLLAYCANPMSLNLELYPELYGVGKVLAVTEYDDLNHLVCARFHKEDKKLKLYKWTGGEADERLDDPDLNVGTVIWEMLSLSHLKMMDLEGLKNVEEVRGSMQTVRHPERTLICSTDEALSIRFPSDPDTSCDALIYQPFATGLDLNIRPEWTRYSSAESMPKLFDELLNCLQGSFPKLDIDSVKQNLIRQESEYSSLVGYDVALPHFHLDELEESVVLIAKMKKPLTDLHSGDPIHLVFLVLSPGTQPKKHLNALSEISQFIMEEQNRILLNEAESREALLEIFFGNQPKA